MGARTGKDYLDGLRDDRVVWLGDRKVDVLTDPRLAGSVEGMAGYFDFQHTYADDCLVTDAETGAPVNASHIVPRTPDDLARRHRALDRLARYSVGFLGRTPDYVNVTLAGFAARRDIFEKTGNRRMGDNIVAFQREAALRDLSLTHTIINPVIDKGVGDVEGLNGELAFRVVRRTSDSIIVSGSKVLGTLGPFADENFVYPSHPLPPGTDPAYALSFSAPVGAKGVHTVCRDHYGVEAPTADLPFSSRFDEQDAFLIFDEVEVPYERVFIDGDLEVYNTLMMNGWAANVLQQTSLRAAVKLEFAYDLAVRLVRCQNMEGRAEATRMLGEVWTYATLTRAGIHAAEAGASDWGNGAWFSDDRPLRAIRTNMPTWMARTREILMLLGSHNLLCTPPSAAFDHPELGPLVTHYLRGANGYTARERSQLFRTAWDFCGTALAGRNELYERFYLASQSRNQSLDHLIAQNTEAWGRYPEFLSVSSIA